MRYYILPVHLIAQILCYRMFLYRQARLIEQKEVQIFITVMDLLKVLLTRQNIRTDT